MVIGSFLENGFEATLSSKTKVLSVWKDHVSFFCDFFSDEVETVLWESETKWDKLFNQDLVTGNFLENGFEATLNSKTNVLSVWKRHV